MIFYGLSCTPNLSLFGPVDDRWEGSLCRRHQSIRSSVTTWWNEQDKWLQKHANFMLVAGNNDFGWTAINTTLIIVCGAFKLNECSGNYIIETKYWVFGHLVLSKVKLSQTIPETVRRMCCTRIFVSNAFHFRAIMGKPIWKSIFGMA